ncbi:hypothetical protein AGABI1DRAFT_128753 [Agaricus bisporus var. burnettii JB137-S8]|uniref:Uncharacterized protein n=1 Tax=Agaricus bisporus var. burnettii (strain JB137-S8 / ATCC MYA-4627 / FGSC 10392) TaxID=597362 RepID=K5X8U4_AGABU|nr:uncharacterized protein AGABI1DRAFT_128753 [Agaricus bisporus var. burnettii JB137-S8]EKM79608.1 hypothetical protein AGABI1DRAFT_128753 [Agaricus bisporus var. burnettii JB137-S8]
MSPDLNNSSAKKSTSAFDTATHSPHVVLDDRDKGTEASDYGNEIIVGIIIARDAVQAPCEL